MCEMRLDLYVVGQTPRSQRAIANLQRICGPELEHCEITIIDVLEQPDLAEAHKVMATPTLIKRVPPPGRRIIGDLSNLQQVANLLDVELGAEPSTTVGKVEGGAV
jgi:circadian clock protein KaiB